MKTDQTLRIYFLSLPVAHTEWESLLGDKYINSIAFKFEYVAELEKSNIVVWDGVITPKNASIINKVLSTIDKQKVLILTGESRTLLKSHKLVSLFDETDVEMVTLPGWGLLPEDIIQALENCQKKFGYVAE